MEDNQQEDVILKVSASKEPGYAKRVAGAMAWQLREKGFVKARAVKQDAVNSAIKALAICNQRAAAADVVLYMELFFSKAENDLPEPKEGEQPEQEPAATAIEMNIQENDAPRPAEFVEYKVSGKPDQERNLAMCLAEAIAAPVKSDKGVSMKCIGPAAVYRGVLASTIARGLIFPNGYDSIVIPTWASLPQEDKNLPPISLINIDFWGRKIA